ncbi:hypothetical protein [Microbacterium sp. MEC084]|uniref:hypothetical protein n=1 Tax=Microbacterium sp. MEC084 TaxID=1963027 RepID=UPI001431A9C4|nr:hypothetical protein [Microbacterium sp. MEC084]
MVAALRREARQPHDGRPLERDQDVGLVRHPQREGRAAVLVGDPRRLLLVGASGDLHRGDVVPRERHVDLEPAAGADALVADRVRAHQHGAQQPDHPREPPDPEDEDRDAHDGPPVHDQVQDRDLDRRQHDEDPQDGEHGAVVREPRRARGQRGAAHDARAMLA